MERVVITGMGIVTPLGDKPETLWRHMLEGRSGITAWEELGDPAYKTRIGGIVRDFQPASIGRFGPKELRRMDRFCQFAVAAAYDAWRDADLGESVGDSLDPGRVGVYIGSGIGGIGTLLENHRTMLERGPGRVSPTMVPLMITNMAAAQVSILLGAMGPTMSPVTACSIGNTAIGEAFKLIQRGGADVVVAGGAEAALSELALAGFGNATALSRRNDEPHRASRPFDTDRDGFIMSEGAGILVVEGLDHARRRGARIHAEVIGYGASSDAYHMVAPHPDGEGAYRAMAAALADAGLRPEEIDTVSAHATSTDVGDAAEASALRRLFGSHVGRLPVTANKSSFGHMLGATGAVEAVVLIKSLQEGLLPPTLNLEHPDPTIGLDVVGPSPRPAPGLRTGLSNSFGFGGHNAVLVLKKYEA
ncbi:beta-ketoacyl-ACP synthase II [Gorillibacterium sp. sgz5001074]|uniref:beta-ketoacyl-ACP synthase II n=1 Tax=Gorillibacterium sp. sgz5001074 TaxID=3446695 RepID=UPI003F66468E